MNLRENEMGIYWCAIDKYEKEKINPPKDFSIKTPGLFHPKSPFPGMVMMKNAYGFNFQLVNDSDWEGPYYDDQYKDITEEVYAQYLEKFPEAKEFYEGK